jgi:hypothetical protein
LRRSTVRLASREFVFDHLREVVIAIVMLKDLDQLRIRQRLKRNESAILSIVVQSVQVPAVMWLEFRAAQSPGN